MYNLSAVAPGRPSGQLVPYRDHFKNESKSNRIRKTNRLIVDRHPFLERGINCRSKLHDNPRRIESRQIGESRANLPTD